MYKITIEQIGRDRDEEIVIRCHELGDEVTAIINKLKKSETSLLGTKDGETFRIAVKDVCYIESVDNKTFICTEKNVFESRQKLYELEEMLKDKHFLRILRKDQIPAVLKILFKLLLPG